MRRALLILTSLDLIFIVLAAIGSAYFTVNTPVSSQGPYSPPDLVTVLVGSLEGVTFIAAWLLAVAGAILALVAAAQRGAWGWFVAIILVAVIILIAVTVVNTVVGYTYAVGYSGPYGPGNPPPTPPLSVRLLQSLTIFTIPMGIAIASMLYGLRMQPSKAPVAVAP